MDFLRFQFTYNDSIWTAGSFVMGACDCRVLLNYVMLCKWWLLELLIKNVYMVFENFQRQCLVLFSVLMYPFFCQFCIYMYWISGVEFFTFLWNFIEIYEHHTLALDLSTWVAITMMSNDYALLVFDFGNYFWFGSV